MDRQTRPPEAAAPVELVAELLHDTAANDRPAGVRSASLAPARRLLFAVGEAEVMVQVSRRADGGSDVAGQVAEADIPLAGVPVCLEVDGECRAGVTERGGGFWFPAPGGAVCRLVFDAHGYEVRTADFRAAQVEAPSGS